MATRIFNQIADIKMQINYDTYVIAPFTSVLVFGVRWSQQMVEHCEPVLSILYPIMHEVKNQCVLAIWSIA